MRTLARFTRSRYIVAVLLLLIFTFAISYISGCSSKTSDYTQNSERSTNKVAYEDSAAPQTQEIGSVSNVANLDRKIAENGTLNIRVQDVAVTMDKIITMGNEADGYTVSSHIYREEELVSGKLVIKVPQINLAPTINSLSTLGEVTDKMITTQDVTE